MNRSVTLQINDEDKQSSNHIHDILIQLRRNVNPIHYNRINEVCQVLDPNVSYNYISTKNEERLKNVLFNFKHDKELIDRNILVLSGDVSLTPQLSFKGTFICILLIGTRKCFNNITIEHTIVTYEYDTRLLVNY